MHATEPQAAASRSAFRWLRLTPDRVVTGLLVVEVLMWLSGRFLPFLFDDHKGFGVLIALATVGAAIWLMAFWFAVSLLFRPRFQFSIRSLLVLTVAVAIPFSWLAVERKKADEQGQAVKEFRASYGYVRYDYERSPNAIPPGLIWFHDLLGIDFFADVEAIDCTKQLTDKQMAYYLKLFPKTKYMRVYDYEITDAHMKHFRELTKLQRLEIYRSPITDAGLQHLQGLSQLEFVELFYTDVTGVGFEHLQGLPKLSQVSLSGEKVTDRSILGLKGLTQLKALDLQSPTLSSNGVKRLQEALPECEIQWRRWNAFAVRGVDCYSRVRLPPRAANRRQDTPILALP